MGGREGVVRMRDEVVSSEGGEGEQREEMHRHRKEGGGWARAAPPIFKSLICL